MGGVVVMIIKVDILKFGIISLIIAGLSLMAIGAVMANGQGETTILSPSSDLTVHNGHRTLTIHAPDKYWSDRTNEWIMGNPKQATNLQFDKSSGNITYTYDDSYYSVVGQMFLVVNVTENTCNNQGWNWVASEDVCVMWWDELKSFIQDNNMDYDLTIEDIPDSWKYTLKLEDIPQQYVDKVMYVGIKLVDSSGLTWDDVSLEQQHVVVKNRFKLEFYDVIENGHTLTLWDKRTVLIGNVAGNNSLHIDPTLTINGATTEMCGNYDETYDKIEVINSGTLDICARNASSFSGWVNITMIGGNFTVDGTSGVNGVAKGWGGGNDCSGGSCQANQGDSHPGAGSGANTANGGGGGGADGGGNQYFVGSGGGAAFGGDGGVGGEEYTASGSGREGLGGEEYGAEDDETLTMGSGGGGGADYYGSGSAWHDGNDGGGGLKVDVGGTGEINVLGYINLTAQASAAQSCQADGGGGGGSGGHLILIGSDLTLTNAELLADGGDGDSCNAGGSSARCGGGGGGGGRIYIKYTSSLSNSSQTYSVDKGSAGNSPDCGDQPQDGVDGTYYLLNDEAPQISNLQFNTTTPAVDSSVLFNVTVIDANGNDTVDSVTATFRYPNTTLVNISLTQLNEEAAKAEGNYTEIYDGAESWTSHSACSNTKGSAGFPWLSCTATNCDNTRGTGALGENGTFSIEWEDVDAADTCDLGYYFDASDYSEVYLWVKVAQDNIHSAEWCRVLVEGETVVDHPWDSTDNQFTTYDVKLSDYITIEGTISMNLSARAAGSTDECFWEDIHLRGYSDGVGPASAVWETIWNDTANAGTYNVTKIYADDGTSINTTTHTDVFFTISAATDATFAIALPSDYSSFTDITGTSEGGATAIDWISFNFTDFPENYCEPSQLGASADKQNGITKPIFYIDNTGNTDIDIEFKFSSSLPTGVVVGGNSSCTGTYASCTSTLTNIGTSYVKLVDDLSQTDSFANITFYGNVSTGATAGESSGYTLYIYGYD